MNLIQAFALVAPPRPGRAAPPPRFVGTASATPLPPARTPIASRRSRLHAAASPLDRPLA
jgi:hypothetical protein